MKNIRVGTVTMQSVVNGTHQNIERMHQFIQQAHSSDVQILCFPEMNITGYCNRDAILDCAETVPGPSSDQLMEFANQYCMTILAGLPEKQSGMCYISHLVASPDAPLGIYRKFYLGPPEKKLFSPGHEIPIFNDQGVCFGIQLCYDAHFPELSTRMTASGADIIFMPHASPHGTPEQKFNSWMRHLPARAYDNSIFVLACNASGENCAGLTFPGVSMAVDPSGHLLKKILSDDPHLMIVDLKAADLEHVRSHEMRYFFPNRRDGEE
ncbi:MAG: nitrilase [Candidatus Magnetomorum sp.]|nr:nitrilase [Candidatus Magnetomorum sp.]